MNIPMTLTNDPETDPLWPAALQDQLREARRLLATELTERALNSLAGMGDPWLRNARGVCLLRLGRAADAIAELRPIVFDETGFAVLRNAPAPFLANYATALYADSNIDGFFSILDGIRNRRHPSVVRLDDAIRRWRRGMGVGQRIASFLWAGGPPLVLPAPLGEL